MRKNRPLNTLKFYRTLYSAADRKIETLAITIKTALFCSNHKKGWWKLGYQFYLAKTFNQQNVSAPFVPKVHIRVCQLQISNNLQNQLENNPIIDGHTSRPGTNSESALRVRRRSGKPKLSGFPPLSRVRCYQQPISSHSLRLRRTPPSSPPLNKRAKI